MKKSDFCKESVSLSRRGKDGSINKDEPNSGDWTDQREDDRTKEYDEEDENDNTGGAGSTGSAATNS